MTKMFDFILTAVIGFVASLVDGGLGMGFGPISASFLLSLGFGTAVMSAAVNLAQTATALVSAVSHIRLKNINIKLVKHLIIAGVPGGILGTYIASVYKNLPIIKTLIAVILLLMGFLIIIKTANKKSENSVGAYLLPRIRQLWPIGFVGGFFSALTATWGPIVTGTLLVYKSQPRKTIGSVNTAEFVVRLVNVAGFFYFLKGINLEIALPLIIGGVIAAPLAVLMVKKIPPHQVGLGAGLLIIILSLWTILKTIF